MIFFIFFFCAVPNSPECNCFAILYYICVLITTQSIKIDADHFVVFIFRSFPFQKATSDSQDMCTYFLSAVFASNDLHSYLYSLSL